MKNKVLIGLGITILLSFVFYWYELRPASIRSFCNWDIQWGPGHRVGLNLDNFEIRYRSCLRSKGIEK